MKTSLRHTLLAALLALGIGTAKSQTATWNNVGADGDWNNALNWDIGVPAEGTNALINGFAVSYGAPMAATSINGITLGTTATTLNVAAGGLNVLGTVTCNANTTLNINAGGVMTNSVLNQASQTANLLNVSGGNITNATTSIANNASNDGGLVRVNSGTASLGTVTIRRSGPSTTATYFSAGLAVLGGAAYADTITVGTGNSYTTMSVGGGTVTTVGNLRLGFGTAANNRPAKYYQTNGVVVIGGTVDLSGAASQLSWFTLANQPATLSAAGIQVFPNAVATPIANFTNAGTLYLGSSGFNVLNPGTYSAVLSDLGLTGANADWVGNVNLLLRNGTHTIRAADAGAVAHNITLSGVISGVGNLFKDGSGVLTLSGANTYSGNTIVNQGTLAIGVTGTIATTPLIYTASGTVFDVSAVTGGFPHAASKTLSGFGSVVGNFAPLSGAIINPGSNTQTGTLTFSNNVTQAGGVVNHFDLSTNPSGPNNDLVIITGDLNASGVNVLEISGGGPAGSVYPLFKYGGNFNGTTANFSINGASGSVSNDASGKVIYLIIANAIRSPANVTWVGNTTINDWDTINRTNWLNTGVLDYFVTGDNVLFDATGAAHPNVNLVGNNAPASVTVDATANYIFSGTGAISGSASLTKTNTGTLVVSTTNSYSGVTAIVGGVLEAAQLANGGLNSAIGAAGVAAGNLVLNGGTLRYTGPSVTIDRAATFNPGGAGIEVTSAATALGFGGGLAGVGAMTKIGAGQLTLTTAGTYAGGTTISNGVLLLLSTGAAGTGGITNYGATLRVNGATMEDNQLDFHNTCNLEFTGVGSGNIPLRGAWTGDGTVKVNFLTQNSSQTVSIGGEGAGGGHMWDFTGTVDFGTNQGFARLNNNASINFGSSNATFNLGTGSLIFVQRNGGTTTHLGALLGGPNTRLSGARNDVVGITTYSIGGKNLDTLYEGMITNGQSSSSIRPASIIKVGTGKLTLTGLSPYTGLTRVESGTLQVDGNITASPITVQGGTLSGNGSIGNSVDVQFGAYLSPGASSVGRLTVGTMTLNSGATNLMEINKAGGTNDSIAATTALYFGGALVVNNLGGTLADGDVFKLFDAPEGGYQGVFETIELPVLTGPYLFWDTSKLTVDGTIRVYTPKPTITGFGLDGSNLYLTGNNGGNTSTHYIVVTSTNVAAPANLWTPVVTNTFEFDGSFGFTNAVNPATPAQFYRVKTP